jgi:hypothetical protein
MSLFHSAPGAYWLDSGELTGSAITLGIAHAPGHPLYAMLAYASSLIPLGTAAFRVSLLSGLFGAISLVWLYDIIQCVTARRTDGWGRQACVLVPIILFALSSGFFLQSVRAEVYTLHLALLLLATKLALHWLRETEAPDATRALQGALVMGLGLANHHLLMVAFLPAACGWLFSSSHGRALARQHGLWLLTFGALAAGLYAYLPLRSLTDPAFNFGSPGSWERFIDVVLARGFQSSVGAPMTDFGANALAALTMLGQSLTWPLLALSCLGGAVVWRTHRGTAIGLTLLLAGNLMTKLIMPLDPLNPDAFGYFLPAMACCTIFAGSALLHLFNAGSKTLRVVTLTALGVLCMSGGTAADATLDAHSLRTSRSAAIVDAWIVEKMPPGSVIMPIHYALFFNRTYHRAVDGFRSDIIQLHQSFDRRVEGGKPLATSLAKKAPGLRAMLDASVTLKGFPRREAGKLAAVRPLFVEPFPTLEGDIDLRLLSDTGFYMQLSAGPERVPVQSTRPLSHLLRLAGPELQHLSDPKRMMTALGLYTAIVRLKQGQGDGASGALHFAQQLMPQVDFSSISLTDGHNKSTLGELARSMSAHREARDLASWQASIKFALEADYSEIFSAKATP